MQAARIALRITSPNRSSRQACAAPASALHHRRRPLADNFRGVRERTELAGRQQLTRKTEPSILQYAGWKNLSVGERE
jgi:hypothetical protein